MNEKPVSRRHGGVHWTGLTITALLVLLVIYLCWSATSDPRFALENLQGLTPEQVIAKLGPPSVDPRTWGSKRWTPDNKEVAPLILTYREGPIFDGAKWNWRGYSYGIVFKDNHVARVAEGTN